jgi:WD40 repeat protein
VVAIAGAQPTIAFKLKDVDDAVSRRIYGPAKWRFAWSANGKRLAAFWDRDGDKNMAHGVVVYDDTGKILFEDTVADGESRPQCDGDISPDGKQIVCRANTFKAGKSMATLTVWDVALGKQIAKRDWDDTSEARGTFAVFTGDAQGIYTTIGKNSFRIALNAFDAETKVAFPLTTYRAVAYSADRKTILVDHGSLYEETSGKLLRDIRPLTPDGRSLDYQRTTSAVTFSPNGRSLYLACHDGTILMYPYPQNK